MAGKNKPDADHTNIHQTRHSFTNRHTITLEVPLHHFIHLSSIRLTMGSSSKLIFLTVLSFAILTCNSSQSKQRYIELLVAVDSSMVNYHGDSLVPYVMTLMSTVSI